MGNITYTNERILATITPEQTVDLLVAPALLLANPLANDMRIFRIYQNVKGKKKIAILQNAFSVMRAPVTCEWKPYHKADWSGREWSLCRFQIQAELCKEEYEGCLELLEGDGVATHDPLAGGVDALTMAYLDFIKLNLQRDIAQWIWFGDEDFGTNDYVWRMLEDMIEPSEFEGLKATYNRECNGIWRTIFELATNGEIKNQVQAVSAAADATKPSDVEAFFDTMLKHAPSRLTALRSSAPDQRPAFLVQPDIFEAYWSALATRCACAENQYVIEGTPISGVLTYKGYPVIAMYEWQNFDETIGAMGTQSKSMNQRAIFTTRGNNANLAIMHSAAEINDGVGFMVEQGSLKDSFKVYMQADFKLGTGIVDPSLIVFATNIDGLDPNSL